MRLDRTSVARWTAARSGGGTNAFHHRLLEAHRRTFGLQLKRAASLKPLSAYDRLCTQVYHRAKRRWKAPRVSVKEKRLITQVRERLRLSRIPIAEEWTTNQTSVSLRLPTESTTAS